MKGLNLTMTHGNAVQDGSIIDVLCRLDGKPFAFMPVVEGKIQDVVAYDNSYKNNDGWNAELKRRQLLEENYEYIRQLCFDYIAKNRLEKHTLK